MWKERILKVKKGKIIAKKAILEYDLALQNDSVLLEISVL